MGSGRSSMIEPLVEPLTKREKEILTLLADRLTNREIADQLTLALSSVKWYVGQIHRKLGVTSRRQAVTQARMLGLIDNGALSARPLHNLPVRMTSFVGRENQIQALEKLLLEPEIHLITLTGPGGIGKSSLAIQTAANVLASFAHGTWLVLLDAVQASEFLVNAIGAALDLPFTGLVPPEKQLIESLRHKEMLLVLDNFEHLLPEGTKLLMDILHKAPGVKLLVTSRERLNLQAEWAYEVQGLDFPKNGQDRATESYPAVTLFNQRARQTSDVDYSNEEGSFVTRISQLVEGNPLALELAAAWVRALSCREIVEEIERGLGILRALRPDLPERHRSMQAVYDHSWHLLSDGERATFCRLSVFRGGFERQAARQVAGASLATLAALVDKSLIQHHPDGRYRSHTLLRQYTAGELDKAGASGATRDRHLAYFLGLAEQAEPELWLAQQKVWLDRLDSELDNLRTALEWSLSPESKPGIQSGLSLVLAIEPYWWIRGHLGEAAGWLARLLAHPTATNDLNQYANGIRLAAFLKQLGAGDFREAAVDYERSLAIAEAEGDMMLLAHVLRDFGNYTELFGDLSIAQTYLERSLALYMELEHEPGIGTVLRRLGHTSVYRGDYFAARAYYQQSSQVWQMLGNKSEMAQTLLELGRLYLNTEQYPEARAAFDESLTLSREMDDKFRTAWLLSEGGWLEFYDGETVLAIKRQEECLELCRDMGMLGLYSWTLISLGKMASYQEDYTNAHAYFQESLPFLQQTGEKVGQLYVLVSEGLNTLRQGDARGALELFQQSRRSFRERQEHLFNPLILAATLIGLAGLSIIDGNSERGAKLLGTAAALIEATMSKAPFPEFYVDYLEYERILAQVRKQMDESTFERLLQEGRAMAAAELDQILAQAFENA